MRRFHFLLGVLLCLSLCAQQPIDLVILAGQSNAVGQGMIGAALGSLANTDPNRLIYNPTTGQMETLVPGVNNQGEQHGIELSLLAALAEDAESSVAMVKVATNGSSMLDPNPVGPYGVWDVDSQDLYETLVDHALLSITQLESMGYSVTVKALVWWQGESDACICGSGVSTYSDNTVQLFEAFRVAIAVPELPIIVLRIGDNIGGWATEIAYVAQIRTLQDLLAQEPNTTVMDIDSWYTGDIHPPSSSLVAIGYLVADLLIGQLPTAVPEEVPFGFFTTPPTFTDVLGRVLPEGSSGIRFVRDKDGRMRKVWLVE